jgi:hypothetical protein
VSCISGVWTAAFFMFVEKVGAERLIRAILRYQLTDIKAFYRFVIDILIYLLIGFLKLLPMGVAFVVCIHIG